MIKIVWKCINIIATSPKRGMEQAEIMDTFWTYQVAHLPLELGRLTVSILVSSNSSVIGRAGDIHLLGNVAWKTRKFLHTHKIYPWRCIATRGESVSTYPRRP